MGMTIAPAAPATVLAKSVTIGMGIRTSDGHPAVVAYKVPWTSGTYRIKTAELVSDGIQEQARFYNPNDSLQVLNPTEYNELETALRKHVEKIQFIFLRTIGYTLGMDPEVFVRRGTGELMPAFEWLSSKSDAPLVEPTDPKYTFAYWDGYQAEYRMRTSTCLGWVTDYAREGLKTIYDRARAVDPDARLTIDSVVEVPEERLMSDARDHVTLGCMPSLNVYGHEPISVPDARLLPWRFAGAHMHFGFNPPVGADVKPRVIRMLDAIAGVVMTSMFAGLEDPIRRKFYGRAGEYRETSYGLEWRTPGVALMAHPATFNLVWDIARRAVDIALWRAEWIWDATEAEVRQVINEYDIPLAQRVLERNERVLRRLIESVYGKSNATDATMAIITRGMSEYATDPRDIMRNWRLDRPTWSNMMSPIRDNQRAQDWISHAEGSTCNWTRAGGVIMSGERI